MWRFKILKILLNTFNKWKSAIPWKYTALFFIAIFLIIFLANVYLQKSVQGQQTFILTSGSVGGNYNKTGKSIEKYFNEKNQKVSIVSIPGAGSYNNIERLASRFADLAIVQKDVLVKNYFDANGVHNVTVLAPLFREELIIYAHTKDDIPIDQFANIVTNNKVNIGITKLGNTAQKTFELIAQLLKVQTGNISYVTGSYSQLIDKFKNGDIDYIVTFSLPLEEMEKVGAHKVYFSKRQLQFLSSRFRDLSEVKFNTKGGTLGVWAVLIGRNDAIDGIGAKNVIEAINAIPSDQFIGKHIKETHDFFVDKQQREHFAQAIPLHNAWLSQFGDGVRTITKYLSLFILGVVGLFFFIFYIKNSDFIVTGRLSNIGFRYKEIFIISSVVISIYLILVEVLLYFETSLFAYSAIKSKLLDMTRADVHLWNIVRIFTNTDSGIFPLSVGGKIALTLSSYVIWIGIALVALLEFLMYKKNMRRRKGELEVNYTDHIVIAGWNESAIELIKDLHSAAKDYNGSDVDVVCIHPSPEELLNSNESINKLEKNGGVVFVKGYVRDKEVLQMASVCNANTVILLTDDDTHVADERNLLRVLSINKYCSVRAGGKDNTGIEKYDVDLYETNKPTRKVYLVVEVNGSEFIDDLKNAGVNAIINKMGISNGILIQSVLNHGVSELLNNVLTFSGDTNEFYAVDLLQPENAHLRNKTFDELLVLLRKKHILLVAIRVIYRDKKGDVIVDDEVLRRLLKEDGLTRQVLTNPINDIETARKTDGDDHLLVLATSGKHLQKAIAEIAKESTDEYL